MYYYYFFITEINNNCIKKEHLKRHTSILYTGLKCLNTLGKLEFCLPSCVNTTSHIYFLSIIQKC